MNISYENKMNLAFDKPLQYKDLQLYPATLLYYSIFISGEECLDISRTEEKDIRLLRLPYLDYLYEKSLLDEEFKNRWNMLICILNIVLKEEQPFDIIRQDGKLYIKVYQRSEDYELLNKEYTILKTNFLKQLQDKKITNEEIKINTNKLTEIQEKMYKIILINSQDFEEIRQLIMLQNDIKSQHFDKKTEEFLNKMRNKMREAKGSNNKTDIEDLITVVAYSLNKTPNEIQDMTIRRFNRYLKIITSKDDYYMYKQLELGGLIKMKSSLPYWIGHYEPKGKYDDILVSNNDLMSSINNKDDEKI
jgi:hypothetical protein